MFDTDKKQIEINIAKFENYSRICAVLIILISSTVITGWFFNVEILKSVIPGAVSMKFNTAIAMILSGIAILLYSNSRSNTFAKIASATVFTIGILTLSQYAFNTNLGIDQLFFKEASSTASAIFPGRMALAASLIFSIIGLALLLIQYKKISDWLMMVPFVGAYLSTVGYLFSNTTLFQLANFQTTAMSIPTSICFLLFAVGFLFHNSSEGMFADFTGDGAGARVMRNLTIPILILPLAISWLALIAEHANFINSAMQFAISESIPVFISLLFVWTTAASLNKEEVRGEELAGELASTEEKFKILYESSHDAIMIFEPLIGKFSAGNKAATEMFKTKDEASLISLSLDSLSPERQPNGLLSPVLITENLNNALKNGSNYFGWKFKRFNGEEFSATVLLVRADVNGKTIIQATIRDITEESKAQDQLTFLKRAIDDSSDIIFMTDIKGIINYMNAEFTNVYGYGSDEVIGKVTPRIIKSGHFSTEHYAEMWKNILNGAVIKTSLVNKTKDGRFVDIEETINPIHDQLDNIIGFIAIHRDITKKKAQEKELKRLNSFLIASQEASYDGIAIIDPNQEIISSNSKALKILDLSKEVIDNHSGQKGIEYIIDKVENANSILSKFEYLSSHRDEILQDQLTFKNGKTFEIYSAPIFGLDKTFYGRVWYFHDITEAKQERDKISRLEEAKSSFVSVAAHQLRTPITAVTASVREIIDTGMTNFTPSQVEFINIISEGASQMVELINFLLKISRTEAGTISFSLSPIDLKTEINSIINELSPEIKTRAIQINLIQDPDPLPSVFMDKDALRQVIINLLTNAINYSHDNGIIEIRLKLESSLIQMAVQDHGIGIPVDQQDKLFEKFYRAKNAKEFFRNGNGLGLALIKALTDAWGGSVRFVTEENKGTTFFITLPILGKVESDKEVI